MTTAELLEHLFAEAMKLPEKERLQLVVELHETLGPGVVPGDDAAEVYRSGRRRFAVELRRSMRGLLSLDPTKRSSQK